MPDTNKFSKLREAGYKVPVTCGLCNHGCIVKGQDWGTCSLHQYEYLKHIGPDRYVSIHRFGTCPLAEARPSAAALLGALAEFLERKAEK